MKKTLLALAALASMGAALAQPAPPGGPAPRPEHPPREMSRADFMKHAAERFEKMDANHDGKVTPEEHRAAREARREHMQERREHMHERRGEMPHRGEGRGPAAREDGRLPPPPASDARPAAPRP